MADEVDIIEDDLLHEHPHLLEILLRDHTTQRNIFWATDSYTGYGKGYSFEDEITIEKITGKHGNIIQPRVVKSKEEQQKRIKDKAEVFTPSWVCNAQNNLIDEQWFGRKDVFNKEDELTHTWTPTKGKIKFPSDMTWKKYVSKRVLEITCGEAPYLVSRYDTVTGEAIPLKNRIGLLDRKLRVVSENTTTTREWLRMAQKAYMCTYGYEWQGDSLLIARESLLYTFVDYFTDKFKRRPMERSLEYIAYIISWNIWQMDGLKMVIPNSCHDVHEPVQMKLFPGKEPPKEKIVPCPGCKKHDIFRHNGIYALIKDWNNRRPFRFVDMYKK